jgi:hypothetical protein
MVRLAVASRTIWCCSAVVATVEAQPPVGDFLISVVGDRVLDRRDMTVTALLVASERHGCLQIGRRQKRQRGGLACSRLQAQAAKWGGSRKPRSSLSFKIPMQSLRAVASVDAVAGAVCRLRFDPTTGMSTHSPRCCQRLMCTTIRWT